MLLIVHSGKTVRSVFFGGKRNLLSLLRENGFAISANCGGNGTCGKCGVKLLSGALSGEEKGGLYLSCKTEIAADAETTRRYFSAASQQA